MKQVFKSLILVAASVGLLVTLPACTSRVQPIADIENNPIPAGLSMEEIKDGIIDAGAMRNWIITEEEPGHLVGTLNIREHMAKVDIFYGASSYSITYRDSDNLKWKPGEIHRNYNSWVRNLSNDIQLTLNQMAN